MNTTGHDTRLPHPSAPATELEDTKAVSLDNGHQGTEPVSRPALMAWVDTWGTGDAGLDIQRDGLPDQRRDALSLGNFGSRPSLLGPTGARPFPTTALLIIGSTLPPSRRAGGRFPPVVRRKRVGSALPPRPSCARACPSIPTRRASLSSHHRTVCRMSCGRRSSRPTAARARLVPGGSRISHRRSPRLSRR